MITGIRFLFQTELTTFFLGLAAGLVPSITFLIVRGALFEYQEWRKRKREGKGWYDEVERTVNGIKRAWHYPGPRPDKKDRERTVEEMDSLTDELKKYKRNQKTTAEMVEVMNTIIERWDNSREMVRSSPTSHLYTMRAGSLSEEAKRLQDLLKKERKGHTWRCIYKILGAVRENIEKIYRARYHRRSILISYDIYQELKIYLSDDSISEFAKGNEFLCISREFGTEAILYDHDSGKHNTIDIDFTPDGEIEIIDELQGYYITEDGLLERLKRAETVENVPYRDVVSDGESMEDPTQEEINQIHESV